VYVEIDVFSFKTCILDAFDMEIYFHILKPMTSTRCLYIFTRVKLLLFPLFLTRIKDIFLSFQMGFIPSLPNSKRLSKNRFNFLFKQESCINDSHLTITLGSRFRAYMTSYYDVSLSGHFSPNKALKWPDDEYGPITRPECTGQNFYRYNIYRSNHSSITVMD